MLIDNKVKHGWQEPPLLWTGDMTHIPTRGGQPVGNCRPARKCVTVTVWQRGKDNRCLRVPTSATDTDLTFTQM